MHLNIGFKKLRYGITIMVMFTEYIIQSSKSNDMVQSSKTAIMIFLYCEVLCGMFIFVFLSYFFQLKHRSVLLKDLK